MTAWESSKRGIPYVFWDHICPDIVNLIGASDIFFTWNLLRGEKAWNAFKLERSQNRPRTRVIGLLLRTKIHVNTNRLTFVFLFLFLNEMSEYFGYKVQEKGKTFGVCSGEWVTHSFDGFRLHFILFKIISQNITFQDGFRGFEFVLGASPRALPRRDCVVNRCDYPSLCSLALASKTIKYND